MRYDDFELLVMQKGAEGYPTRVISASAGEGQGILSFNSASDDIQRAMTKIKDEDTDEELFVDFGRTLFQRLFSDEIEDIYRASLGYARAQGKGLRIRLRLEPPELGAIPWEYLYDELNDLFLAISPETPITRYIQVSEPPRSITIHHTLKVLAVISNPINLAERGLPALDAEKEKQVLSQALGEWEREGLVQLEFLDHAVASEIREKLRRYQPHIFHFIGHGAFKDDGFADGLADGFADGLAKAYLVIEDDDHRFRLIIILDNQGKGLRIRLRLEPPELGAIPWEYLYDELNDLFLAISPETPITRYIQVSEPPRSITIHHTLKVLAVISNPINLAERGLPALDAEKEKQVLSQALGEWEREGLVQLEFLDHAVASEIREKLRRYQPHIFHFIGHGAFKDDGFADGFANGFAKAYLVIEDDDHRFRLITGRTFREFFLGNDFTKLVVLNTCQSATTSSTQPGSVRRPSPIVGLAPNLVRRGLPAVVAMQYSIYDDTAIKFSREFYRALAVGFPVDTAISEARRGIYIDCGVERRDWGIPVLFMRSPDGVILKLTKPIARPLRLESIPGSGNFIGRENELNEYQWRLDSQNIIVIGGTAGVGKTMLGTQIVAQHGFARSCCGQRNPREAAPVSTAHFPLYRARCFQGRRLR